MTEARTVIVTGASRGIGKASALAFAAEGCNVVLTSRKIETLDEVAAEITARFPGVGVLTHAAHAAEPDQAAAVVEAAMARFGAIDVLVNNAGTNPYFGPLMDIDPVRAEKTVRLNQFGPVLWSQLVWKASMSQRGAGTIVNVASVGGVLTEPGIGYYNATKAAVIHLTRQLAAELAPVRVNAVAPGIVRTHLARGLWESNEDFLNDKLPLGRIGEPDDIADVITFLAGPASRWMTGQTLVVDGGAQIRSSLI
ncbi:SDR family oxidoreductase [Dactylosporangium sp. CA-052675]|uniref:SDR family oxidoreductase n=1 Tax=Dactylosporangium sp. CA-052675 TaxID=3239927 RepID=UPI003D933577